MVPDVRLVPLGPSPSRIPRLPAPLTAFVGRRQEIAAVAALLRDPDVRFVTLAGAGGIGKTRLALQVAGEAADGFPDGVGFVDLSPIHHPDLVILEIAQAFGLGEARDLPLPEHLTATLAGRRLLLVLDNAEHVVAGLGWLPTLLRECPGLKVLVTSRQVLRLSGEHVYPVPPLSLPRRERRDVRREGEAPSLVARLSSLDSVRLFAVRARAVQPAFALTETNVATIAEICRRLDGLPLAIELAAARLRHLSPDALLARLDQRLPLLTGGMHDQPARLRTLRDAIAWSYDLLDEEERGLVRRLAVFVGGCTAAAAVVVGTFADEVAALDGLASLADKSLLRPEPAAEGSRFGMLETIREFGLERLIAAGEEQTARDRHAAYFLDLVERAWPANSARTDQERWLARLEADRDNLREALAWLVERGEAEAALRLAGNLYWFWLMRGYLSEGRAWLQRALALPGSQNAPPAVRALAWLALGTLAHFQGDDEAALPVAEEALRLARAGDFAYGRAMTLLLLGTILEDQGRYDDALPYTEEALVGCREIGNRADEGLALFHLAVIAWGRGDVAWAIARCDEALAVSQGAGDRWARVVTLNLLGLLHGLQGDHERAAVALSEGLRLGLAIGARRELATGLANAAVLAGLTGDPALAARLFGTEEAVRAVVGSDWQRPERAVYERAIAAARRALGESAYEAARSVGRATTPGEAIELVAALTSPPQIQPGTQPADKRPAPLSPRELEVLRLIAAGHSNAEIGEALFITAGTARIHVSNILTKLGARTRTEAAALARDRGLI